MIQEIGTKEMNQLTINMNMEHMEHIYESIRCVALLTPKLQKRCDLSYIRAAKDGN